MNKTMNLDNCAATLLAVDSKPSTDIMTLCAALQADAGKKEIQKSKIISYTHDEKKMCLVLHSGSIAVHRCGDSLVMVSEAAPFIFGLCGQLNTEDSMYLRTLEVCEISSIPLEQVRDTIIRQNLWKALSHILIYTTTRIYQHCAQIHQMSAYDIIRFQLTELSRESEVVRMNTTVANYIKTRTYLSRSGIMRILSELRTGGYISIEKGLLKSITFLPKKY